jgi:hypothetical protein
MSFLYFTVFLTGAFLAVGFLAGAFLTGAFLTVCLTVCLGCAGAC